MFRIFALALLLVAASKCQLLRDEERPTRYVLPYAGLGGADEPEVEEKQYYKPNRRAERIPATAYQYDDAEEDYYRPQPRQKVEEYRYQSTPSHKDYEEILKSTHLARLRLASKKQTPVQTQSQPQSQTSGAEQYLKEVSPTTSTKTYQRPSYLRFAAQAAQKQENEEAPVKQSYRYVVQPEQRQYSQYQYEQEQAKPKPPRFNLVAYQKALLAQQKLIQESGNDESPNKQVYGSQKKIKKPKTSSTRTSSAQQYEYFPQVPPQRSSFEERYPKTENYPDDSYLYQDVKDVEYQTTPPVRATKQRTTKAPRRKPKYQTEEQEDYPAPTVLKYQDDQVYEYQTPKYEENYRRPAARPNTKLPKYEDQSETKEDYLYQPKYQPRRAPAYQEAEARPRYITRQYQDTDLAYQPTADVPVTQVGRGVSYRQTFPFITPPRHIPSDYQNAFIEEDTRHFKTLKMYPSTQYTQRHKFKLSARPEEELDDVIPNESVYSYTPVQYVEPPKREPTRLTSQRVNLYRLRTHSTRLHPVDDTKSQPEPNKFKPENVVKMKGFRYPRRKPTYLNGQSFIEKVTPPSRYYEDLATQSTSHKAVRYNSEPFLIVVYDK